MLIVIAVSNVTKTDLRREVRKRIQWLRTRQRQIQSRKIQEQVPT